MQCCHSLIAVVVNGGIGGGTRCTPLMDEEEFLFLRAAAINYKKTTTTGGGVVNDDNGKDARQGMLPGQRDALSGAAMTMDNRSCQGVKQQDLHCCLCSLQKMMDDNRQWIVIGGGANVGIFVANSLRWGQGGGNCGGKTTTITEEKEVIGTLDSAGALGRGGAKTTTNM
jgi:hypothetical protein